MRRHGKAVLGIVISALLIWWVLRGVDLGAVWTEVREANGWLLLAAVAVATSGFLVRAMRWEILLRPIRTGTGLHNRFAAVNIGFAANNLLPARVGEFARAWSISRLETIPMSGAVGSLVAERFLDILVVFSLLVVAVLHPTFPLDATLGGRPFGETLTVFVSIVVGLVIGVALLLSMPATFLRIVRAVTSILPDRFGKFAEEILESFINGLGALRSPGLLASALAWSFGFWIWNAFSFWLAFRAFGIEEAFPTALFVQGIVAVGVAIPAAPGFFGTFHAAAVLGLHEVYGVAEASTLAFAFGYHLGGFIPVTLIGLWYAGRIGVSWRDLGRADESVEAALDRELSP